MKANLAILTLLFIAFHVGAEALKCYTDADSHRKEVPCAKGEEQCYLSLGKHDKDMSPRAYGCIDKEEEAECQSPGCTMCDTDLCNTLQCYSSEKKEQVGCGPDEMCITLRSTDERKCGRCDESDRDDECEQCNEDMCNKPALKCYNDFGPNPIKIEQKCDRGEKKCWIKKADPGGPPQAHGCASKENEAECQENPTTCTLCDTSLCNVLKCYSSSKEEKEVVCTDRDDMCITSRRTDERKCGKCTRHPFECRECADDMCNKPLYCLDSAEQIVQCKDVPGAGPPPKCVTILDKGRAIEKKCGTCSSEEIKQKRCEECDSDKCNAKPVQPLNCYNATNQVTKCEDVRDHCITIIHKSEPRAIDRKCGTCDNWQYEDNGGCLRCISDGCNKMYEIKLLSCFNATGKLTKCTDTRDNCVTIRDRGRVVDKKCGTCPLWSETCEDCNSDGCNEMPDIQPLKCQNNKNEVEECKDVRDYCYTKRRTVTNWDGHWNDLVEEKGCGKCNGSTAFDGESFTYTVAPGAKVECKPCYTNGCNNEKLEEKLDCFDESVVKNGSTKQCNAGEKCVVAYTKEDDKWALHQHCGLCPTNPPKLGFCKQCNSSKCNVYEYPKCKAGDGNGAGDFFVDKKCTEKLYLNKDENITTTCIKQQVEGITYKDCGSCDANINKCHEYVSTEGDTELCNGAILAHRLPVPFWLLLVIGKRSGTARTTAANSAAAAGTAWTSAGTSTPAGGSGERQTQPDPFTRKH